jgi:hypothetical protein
LKSLNTPPTASFGGLQARLIRFVNDRISNGDSTERALARVLCVSQPQLHHVLKGARKLTPHLADRILACFGMSVLDLLECKDLYAHLNGRSDHLTRGAQEVVAGHIEIRKLSAEFQLPKKRPVKQLRLHNSDEILSA